MAEQMETKGYKRALLNETAYKNEKSQSGDYYSGLPSYTSNMPVIALRTNLLYGAGALTPNLGVEIGLARRFTLELAGGYNDWKKDDGNEYKRLSHWIGHIEGRYWFCERFNGHYIGIHGYYSQYKIAGHKIPFLFDDDDAKERMYDGSIYGAGISYGYQFMLGKRWNLELTAGAGFGMMEYDKYECERCGELLEGGIKKTVFTPTKLGVSLIFIIK